MFGNILDLVASIYTVTLCRLHRIFGGLIKELLVLKQNVDLLLSNSRENKMKDKTIDVG